MILHCPHCHVKVERDQKHCATCRRVMIRRCPACAEDISVLAALCKYCGESVVPATVAALVPVPVPVPAPPPAPKPEIEFVGDVRSVAWEDPKAGGRMRRWWKTWGALTQPGEFWRRAPLEGGHCKPISFAWFPIAQILTLLLPFVFVGTALACPMHPSISEKVAFGGFYLLLYPLTYVAVALGTWIKALAWHVPLKILGGSGGYQGTVRAVAYNSGAQMWHLVPILGTVVAIVLGTALNYHAFRNVHGMGKFRAGLAASLPFILVGAAVAALVAGLSLGIIQPHYDYSPYFQE
ncbi:MAG TPA: YIP1 family protein [Planctomycetota bacterium]|jgi:hypothetical protein